MSRQLLGAWSIAALAIVGCGSEGDEPRGKGTVSIRAYGETFIEEGIPAENMHDGWTVSFDRFDVTLRDIVVGGVSLEDPQTLDLSSSSEGEGHEVGTLTVDEGPLGEPSFTIARLEVDGAAEKEGVEKTFSWVFDSPTNYAKCDTSTRVEPGEIATFEITVHADHLFSDSLVSEAPQLLFQPLADADSDDDGVLTSAELANADIGAYDPGNEKVKDLWSWLVAQHRTLGHVDGEGHCAANPVED